MVRGLPARFASATSAVSATAVTATTATSSRRLRTRLVYSQAATSKTAVVELRDGSLGTLIGGHLDKRETTRPAGFTIADDVDRLDRTGLGKQLLEIVLVRFVGNIADVQLLTHMHSCIR